MSLAPNHALAQYLLASVYIYTNRAAEGITKCEHALALDRNLAAAHVMIGLAKYFTGRAEETESHVLEALRLSPRDTFAYTRMIIAGIAKLVLGRDEEAAIWLLRSIDANRNHSTACRLMEHIDRLAYHAGRGEVWEKAHTYGVQAGRKARAGTDRSAADRP
jgi:tetratricopeptide (TPR) repeat protein